MDNLPQPIARQIDHQKQQRGGELEPRGMVAQAVALYLPGPAESADKCPNDVLIYLLDILVAAENVDSVDLVVDYLAWARGLMANLGFPGQNLTASLDHLAMSIERDGGFYGGRLANLLRRAERRLDQLAPGHISQSCDSRPLTGMAAHYLDDVLAGRDGAAEQRVIDAADRGMPLADIYIEIIGPVMREVGRLWHANRISVAQEHYVSATVQAVLGALYPRLFNGPAKGPVMMVACVQGDLHEIGPRMVADLFQANGWDSHFLGSDTAPGMVASFAEHVDAELVALSAMMTGNLPALAAQIALLRARDVDGKRKILVGGHPFSLDADLWRRVGADGYAADGHQALDWARALPGWSRRLGGGR